MVTNGNKYKPFSGHTDIYFFNIYIKCNIDITTDITNIITDDILCLCVLALR